MKYSEILWVFLRVVVGFIFAYAGLSKLLFPVENFAAILSNYEIIPKFALRPIAHALPWVEWISGSLLILGYAVRLNAGILAAVTLSFLMVLVSGFVMGHPSTLDCGCFGDSGLRLSQNQVLIMDSLNYLILIRLLLLRNHAWSLDGLLCK